MSVDSKTLIFKSELRLHTERKNICKSSISEWILRNPSRAILKLIREIKGILGLQEFLDTRESNANL